MSIKRLKSRPEKNIYIAESADVCGDVRLSDGTSIWYNCVVRGDDAPITIGENTNIQDLVMIHTSPSNPTKIGRFVTVGHGAILHGCTVNDGCLIGMGAIILDGAEIGEGSIVGAGALVTQNKSFPKHVLILGSPAKVVRPLSEQEILDISYKSELYLEEAKRHFAE